MENKMTLEHMANDLIMGVLVEAGYPDRNREQSKIQNWHWVGRPWGIQRQLDAPKMDELQCLESFVDKMIQEANEVECVTSPSHYIRECRKWYEERRPA